MDERLSVPISKVDPERRIFGGWAYVVRKADGSQVVDHSGDMVDTEEAWSALEDAFYDYALEGRSGDYDHEEFGAADLVELIVLDRAKRAALGLAEGSTPDGVYVSFKARLSPAGRRLWAGVKGGSIRSLSIVGDGWREPLDGEDGNAATVDA